MTDLTDRYVAATLRSIPRDQRADLEAELRASIDDAVEAKVSAGEGVAPAERAVLTQLGDPDRLAAGYADRVNHLVGPEHFFDYKRLLTAILAVTVPVVALVTAVVRILAGDGIGEVIGGTLGLSLTLAVHIAFWTTLVFAVIERSDTQAAGTSWSPDDLPPEATRGSISFAETLMSIVVQVLVIAVIVTSRSVSPVTAADGTPVELFDPGMWDVWLPVLVCVFLLEVVFEVVKYRMGRWTWSLALVNVALTAAFVIPVVYLLATDQVLNPAFFTELGAAVPEAGGPTITITIATIVVICLWDIVDGFVKAWRSGRE